MALETGVTYIEDLVDTNPVGATDNVDEGDDHIRNIKTAVQGSFPSLGAAAVTKTAAEINDLATKTGTETLTNKTLTSPTINGVTGYVPVFYDATGGYWENLATDSGATGVDTNWTTVNNSVLSTAQAKYAIIRIYAEVETVTDTAAKTADVFVYLGTSGFSGAPPSSRYVDTCACIVAANKPATTASNKAINEVYTTAIVKLDGSYDFQYSIHRGAYCETSSGNNAVILDLIGYYV